MTKTRIILIAALAAAPFLFLMGAGSFHLWNTGWAFIAWWPMAASLTLAYFFGWRWTRKNRNKLLPGTGTDRPPNYWTDTDRRAWDVVEAQAAAVQKVTVEEFADAKRYSDGAIALALAVARVYRPSATDPFMHLTLPEILACGELVAHDLSAKVGKYVPGSHLMSVGDWKKAKQLADWGEKAWNISWVARMIYDPLNAGTQFLAAKAGGAPLRRIQDNILVWFQTAYIHELGRYLIELNSGRLKVGATRYLELMAEHQTPPTDGPAEEKPAAKPVTVAIVGQVKAGKSTLVNALLGEQKAATDVLPLTAGSTRYELNQPDLPRLTLIDTAGYGQAGPTEAEFAAALEAAKEADLLLLATPARSAARRADVELLEKLAAAFAARPELRKPPIFAALTQADLLSPASEWAPPYDWPAGTRPKEANMREAVAAAKEQFGDRVIGSVPVCASPGKEHGVRDDLLGAMAGVLDDARGSGLLRALHAEAAADRGKRVLHQVLNVGREALGVFLNAALKKPT